MIETAKREGMIVQRLAYGGFIVRHANIYELGALFFAATTIDEAFEFVRGHLVGKSVGTDKSDEIQ